MDICKKQSSDRPRWGNCSKLGLYCKNLYNPIVKVSNWEKYGESLPIDIDPSCPFDLHYSHYNKIGGDNSPINYRTTTEDMLQQVFTKRSELEINPHKPITNLYSDLENKTIELQEQICSSPYRANFRTTMQHSYQPPYPYLLKRLSMAEPPYFLHRFLKGDESCKFLDDNHVTHTKKLQAYKSAKYISYNPLTGYYTDGTMGDISDIY